MTIDDRVGEEERNEESFDMDDRVGAEERNEESLDLGSESSGYRTSSQISQQEHNTTTTRSFNYK